MTDTVKWIYQWCYYCSVEITKCQKFNFLPYYTKHNSPVIYQWTIYTYKIAVFKIIYWYIIYLHAKNKHYEPWALVKTHNSLLCTFFGLAWLNFKHTLPFINAKILKFKPHHNHGDKLWTKRLKPQWASHKHELLTLLC